jgi:hypothetical protein
MPTIHDDNATTWRDLADALTPHQVAYIENWEAHPEIPPMADGTSAPPEQRAAALLFTAREYVGQNAAGALFADVPPPPDPGTHYPWEHDGDGKWFRFFAGTTREIAGAQVVISGLQSVDGTITRTIAVDGDSESLDSGQARQLAALLIEAADELERLQ